MVANGCLIHSDRDRRESSAASRDTIQDRASGSPHMSPAARIQSLERDICRLKSDLARHGLLSGTINRPLAGRDANLVSRLRSSRDQQPFTISQRSESPAKCTGRHVVEGSTGATIYLGCNSEPALLLGCRQDDGYGDLDLGAFNQLAPTTYPFANIWRPDIGLPEVLQTLPPDNDIMRYLKPPFNPTQVIF